MYTKMLVGLGTYTYRVILRIVKAGCPVAIAQVVEHCQLKSEAPFNPSWLPVFHSLSKKFLSLFHHVHVVEFALFSQVCPTTHSVVCFIHDGQGTSRIICMQELC